MGSGMSEDFYASVFGAVLKALEAGESEESIDDAVTAAMNEYLRNGGDANA
jgi:hypothetical protein